VSPAAAIEGQQVFASRCAACHGLDGRGGERAPNIASGQKAQSRSDAAIIRIVRDGVPGTGMPSFRPLGDSAIKAVVAHLRTLQGKTRPVKLPGDPERGKSVFFGKAGCSECHMIAGVGGFIGADLSAFAGNRSADEIREAITDPSKNPNPRARAVVAITRDGHKYEGIARNEDNFSLQLQTLDGVFHFFLKSGLQSLEYQPQSLMPSDYGSRFSRGELDDLISYLVSTAKISKPEQTSGDDREE
jgi:cytochrome c oxidase cbb3-type subunit 3